MISRAHRMGAVRPIHVETLAMRGTIEEQMLEFLQVVHSTPFLLLHPSSRLRVRSLQPIGSDLI